LNGEQSTKNTVAQNQSHFGHFEVSGGDVDDTHHMYDGISMDGHPEEVNRNQQHATTGSHFLQRSSSNL
jgi:hypothetical protein